MAGVAGNINQIGLSSVQNANKLTTGMTGQNLGGQYAPFLQQQSVAQRGLANQYAPVASQNYGNLANLASGSPYSNQLMQGANTGAGYGATTAANAMGMQAALMPYAQQLLGYGLSLLPRGQELFGQGQKLFDQSGAMFGQMPALYAQGQDLFAHEQPLYEEGNRIAEMGFDPQSALYARTLQQIQDQQRAGQSARGLGASPYGAGLEGDATRNFNIDWQNQQLGRAATAGQAMQGLYGQAANLGQTGIGAYNAAANLGQTAGGLATAGGGLYQQGGQLGQAASDIGQGAAAIDTSAFNLGSGATDLAARSAALPYTAQQSLYNDLLNAQQGAYDTQKGLTQDKINAVTGQAAATQALNQPRQQVISDYLSAAGLGPGYTQAAASSQNANTNMLGTLLHLVGK